jgi:hypothetical protein
MASSGPLLTEAQWKKKWRPCSPTARARQGGSPVDRQSPCIARDFVDSAQWRRWRDLPERYRYLSTCWRRLRDWSEAGRRGEHRL